MQVHIADGHQQRHRTFLLLRTDKRTANVVVSSWLGQHDFWYDCYNLSRLAYLFCHFHLTMANSW